LVDSAVAMSKRSAPFKIPAGWALLTTAALCFGYLLWKQPASPAGQVQKVPNFRMLDHQGRSHELYYYRDAKAVVLFWQGNGCPIVRLSVSKIAELEKKYAQRGVLFFMVNANPQDDLDSISREAEEFRISLPILKDETQFITSSLGVERTADAVLIDPKSWTVAYHGPLDDSLGYESQRSASSHRYLDEAIDSLLRKKRIKKQRVEAKGCLIDLPDKNRQISYEKEVAPILQQKCLRCHNPGGMGPWAMTGYPRVKGWARMMEEVLLTKRMPPGGTDPRYGRFFDDPSLSTEESKTLLEWIQNGCPRGQGADPLETPLPPIEEWPLGKPDEVILLPVQSIPATGIVPWKLLRIETHFGGDKWLRAAELVPSNQKILHHATVDTGRPSPQFNMETDPSLDRIGVFLPGLTAGVYPDQTGGFLAEGDTLHFVLHYVTTGKPEEDHPKLALYFHPSKPLHRMRVAFSNLLEIRIPPNKSDYLVKGDRIRFSKDVLLYTMCPHMHYRARSFKATALYPDGTSEILLSVPDYSFNWQRVYRLKEPKRLPAGTVIESEAVFDNSKNNPLNPDASQWVSFGFQSFNEMLALFVNYVELDDHTDIH